MFTFLFAAFVAQSAPVSALMPLTDTHRRDMRCAALFAIVSTLQKDRSALALVYPDVTQRGRAYFADIGERVVRETGQTKETVQREFLVQVWQWRDAIDIPEETCSVIAAGMETCLPLLDAADTARMADDATTLPQP